MASLISDPENDGPHLEDGEHRCCCGRLLAVRVAAGYEIRCSRCKTVRLLPLGTPGDPLDAEDETR